MRYLLHNKKYVWSVFGCWHFPGKSLIDRSVFLFSGSFWYRVPLITPEYMLMRWEPYKGWEPYKASVSGWPSETPNMWLAVGNSWPYLSHKVWKGSWRVDNKKSSTTLFGELAVPHTLTPQGQKLSYTMIMLDLALCISSPGSSFIVSIVHQ